MQRIYDIKPPPTPFIFTVRAAVANDTFELPLQPGTYNFSVDWGDGSPVSKIRSNTDAKKVHTYGAVGDYDVTIRGVCEHFAFNNAGDKTKIIEVKQWGDSGQTDFTGIFHGCTNLATVSDTGAGFFDNAVNMSLCSVVVPTLQPSMFRTGKPELVQILVVLFKIATILLYLRCH